MIKFCTAIRYILFVHFSALILFFLIRILLIGINSEQLSYFENNLHDLFWILALSFSRGLWFDNIVATIITSIPLFVFCILFLLKKLNQRALFVSNIYYIAIYTIIWATSIADIPYFNYFFKHLDTSIIMWKNDPTAYKMLLEENSYYIYFGLFVLFSILFAVIITKMRQRLIKNNETSRPYTERPTQKRVIRLIPSIVFLLALICGNLGLFIANPFGRNLDRMGLGGIFPLLGVNALYHFTDSLISSFSTWNSVDDIINEKEAITYIQDKLNIIPDSINPTTPIIHNITATGNPTEANIVVIIMESMSSDFLYIKENGKTITPFLNELIAKSYYFSNIFSPGNHTSQGIAAGLYGQPCIFEQHMLDERYKYSGLSKQLKLAGYETSFFLTHDPAFDNTGFSAAQNSFSNVYSMNDYPPHEQVNALGVSDSFLFDFGIDKINAQTKDYDKPFFSTFLTVSNHPPYIVPEEYQSISNNQQYQIVSYCDDALRKFFEKASKQEWYKNTIFVLFGDHGAITSAPIYEIPVSLHHIPLIVYSPLFDNIPRQIDKVGSQIDIYPTIMGLLNRSYPNNSIGIDLMRCERTSAPISEQNTIAAIDNEFLYCYNIRTKAENLYKYKDNDRTNYLQQYRAKADSMIRNSAAILQVSNYMLKNNLTQY